MPGYGARFGDTDMAWKRVYVGPKRRLILHSDLTTDHGTYRLRRPRDLVYRVSFIAKGKEDEVDLGQYRQRRECEQRVREHMEQGR